MYQVLARKWRPQNFHELVGQAHVTQALTYALDNDRLHHAYLFTGTRGVGKTTIARIFAKSLNCLNNGVSSNPCGECTHCKEIEQGRFPDLIEVDAASRTGVDDTRELLDNVPYAPVKGRYKVYLIDEVHMFSKSSFNALLKTLEEPPAHVKFILATTDPQKLPATVLSRCLQFHLKNMNERQIIEHMHTVLDGENISYEDEAVRLIAQAANGSMRDGLSLLDQAIAYGRGHIRVQEVANLLGAIPTTQLHHLLKALVVGDAKVLRQQLHDIDEFAPDYGDILARLLEQFQLITIAQLNAEQSLGEVGEFIRALADALPVELVQLWYQIATDTWRNMPYQPDARMALEMGLLRMIALQPVFPTDKLSEIKPIAQAEEPILAEDAPSVSAMAEHLSTDAELDAPPDGQASTAKDDNLHEQGEKKNSTVAELAIDLPNNQSLDASAIKTDTSLTDNLGDEKGLSLTENTPQTFVQQSKQSEADFSAQIESDDNEPPPWVEPLGEKMLSTVAFATNDVEIDQTMPTNAVINSSNKVNSNKKPNLTTSDNDIEDNKTPQANQSITDDAFDDMDTALNSCIGQPERWEALIKYLNFSGEALMLADFSLPIAWQAPKLTLCCQEGNDAWVTPGRQRAVATTFSQHYGRKCEVVVEKKSTVDTPYKRKLEKEEKRMAKAKQDFLQHPQVKSIVATLHAEVDINSIKILDESKESL